MEGFLEKKGSLVKSWRRRLFVLTSKRLRYHLQHSYEPQKGEILLSDITDIAVDVGGDMVASSAGSDSKGASGGLFRKNSTAAPVGVLTLTCSSRLLHLRGPTSDIDRWFSEIKAVLARLKAASTPVDPEVGQLRKCVPPPPLAPPLLHPPTHPNLRHSIRLLGVVTHSLM